MHVHWDSPPSLARQRRPRARCRRPSQHCGPRPAPGGPSQRRARCPGRMRPSSAGAPGCACSACSHAPASSPHTLHRVSQPSALAGRIHPHRCHQKAAPARTWLECRAPPHAQPAAAGWRACRQGQAQRARWPAPCGTPRAPAQRRVAGAWRARAPATAPRTRR